MTTWLCSLSSRVEFLLVVTIGFGYFIWNSFLQVLLTYFSDSPPTPVIYSTQGLNGIVFYELFALSLIGWFLSRRGWTFRDVHLNFSWAQCGGGILLVIASHLLFILCSSVVEASFAETESFSQGYPQQVLAMSLTSIVMLSLVNGFYEEILVVGYVVEVLQKMIGVSGAVLVSVGLRVLYHLYQGPYAIIDILPLGVLLAYVYVRWRKLGPLIMAHSIMDLYGLLALQLA